MRVKSSMPDKLPSGGVAVAVIHGATVRVGFSMCRSTTCASQPRAIPIPHSVIQGESFSLILVFVHRQAVNWVQDSLAPGPNCLGPNLPGT